MARSPRSPVAGWPGAHMAPEQVTARTRLRLKSDLLGLGPAATLEQSSCFGAALNKTWAARPEWISHCCPFGPYLDILMREGGAGKGTALICSKTRQNSLSSAPPREAITQLPLTRVMRTPSAGVAEMGGVCKGTVDLGQVASA